MRIIINEGRKVAVPNMFIGYYEPGFTVDCRELHFGDY